MKLELPSENIFESTAPAGELVSHERSEASQEYAAATKPDDLEEKVQAEDDRKITQILERIEAIPRNLEIVDALSAQGITPENAILKSNDGRDFTYKRRIGNFTYAFHFEKEAASGIYQVSFTTDEARYALLNQGLSAFRKIMDTVVEILEKIKEADPSFEGIKFSGMKENVTLEDKNRLAAEKEQIANFLMSTYEETPEKYGGFSFNDGYDNVLTFENGQFTRTYADEKKEETPSRSVLNYLKSFFAREKKGSASSIPYTKSFPVNGDLFTSMTTAESIAFLRHLGYFEKEAKDQETASAQRKNAYTWYIKKKLPNAKIVNDEKSDVVYVYV